MSTTAQLIAPQRSTRLSLALLLVGFTSITAQVVLLRELMVVSYGNELSLGMALAAWLAWTALGSILAGWIFRQSSSVRVLAGLQVLSAASLPVSVSLARLSRLSWGDVPGEALGPVPILLTAVVTLCLFCLLSGSLFAVGSRVWAASTKTTCTAGSNSMYLLEAAGSAGGGLIASLVLLRMLDSFQIGAVLLFLNLCSAIWLIAARRRIAILLTILLLPFGYAGLVWGHKADVLSTAAEWRGFRLVATRNSRYGNLAVIEGEGNRSLLQSGVVLFTSPDPSAAEEAVHFPLLEHPSPHSVLLLGGGLNGSIEEALKHPSVRSIDFVELDPAILTTGRDYFQERWNRIAGDPRVHTHNIDGRAFLKHPGSTFDAIIVSLPEPLTAQLNRYYTVEFFRDAATRLTKDGVLGFHLPGGEEYRSPERKAFLRAIYATLQQIFPQVVVIPGETVCFVASTRPQMLAADPQELISRLRERNVRTGYVSEYFLPYRMSSERIVALRAELDSGSSAINHDFAPIAYYFGVTLWGSQFSSHFVPLFRAAASLSFHRLFLAGVLAGLIGALFLLPRSHRSAKAASGMAVLVAGFALMAVEVLVLLGFQVIYGYIFEALALLISAYMTGLALGSWTVKCRPERSLGRNVSWLLLLQLTILVSPLLLAWKLHALSQTRTLALWLLPATALAAGFLGGAQFSLATRVFFASESGWGSAGTLYGLDLLGASLGAVLISVYLLPVFGFFRTSLTAAAMGTGSVLLLLVVHLRMRTRA